MAQPGIPVEAEHASLGRSAMPELDTFRGVAAILMVINHAGFKLLEPDDALSGLSGGFVFGGGFAPVLFFFATGFGAALGAGRRGGGTSAMWLSVATKAALLLLADQFLFWRSGISWGLDFFGFIALCSVASALVATRKRPLLWAAGLAVGVVALRYVLAPPFKATLPSSGVVAWFVGISAQPDISYPAAPWLAYPALGYCLGHLYQRWVIKADPAGDAWRRRVAFGLAAGVAVAGLAAALDMQGVSFHRWGSVAAGFFVLSLAVLLVATALSLWLTKVFPRLAAAVALRGVASFAVVPVHYILLELCIALGLGRIGAEHYFLLLAGLVPASLWLAGRFDVGNAWLTQRVQGARPCMAALVGLCVLTAVLMLDDAGPVTFAVAMAGQLLIAGLLAKARSQSLAPTNLA